MANILSMASDVQELKKTLPLLMTQVISNKPSISENDLYDLRLIFSELLLNAIIHGNKSDFEKKVQVTIKFTDDGVISRISDQGAGFNHMEVMASDLSGLFSESGRGIRLVSSLADELTFNAKGNEIAFFKRITNNP